MKFNLQTIIKTVVIFVCGLIVLYVVWLAVLNENAEKQTDQQAARQAALTSCLSTARNTDSKDYCYLIHPQE